MISSPVPEKDELQGSRLQKKMCTRHATRDSALERGRLMLACCVAASSVNGSLHNRQGERQKYEEDLALYLSHSSGVLQQETTANIESIVRTDLRGKGDEIGSRTSTHWWRCQHCS